MDENEMQLQFFLDDTIKQDSIETCEKKGEILDNKMKEIDSQSKNVFSIKKDNLDISNSEIADVLEMNPPNFDDTNEKTKEKSNEELKEVMDFIKTNFLISEELFDDVELYEIVDFHKKDSQNAYHYRNNKNYNNFTVDLSVKDCVVFYRSPFDNPKRCEFDEHMRYLVYRSHYIMNEDTCKENNISCVDNKMSFDNIRNVDLIKTGSLINGTVRSSIYAIELNNSFYLAKINTGLIYNGTGNPFTYKYDLRGFLELNEDRSCYCYKVMKNGVKKVNFEDIFNISSKIFDDICFVDKGSLFSSINKNYNIFKNCGLIDILKTFQFKGTQSLTSLNKVFGIYLYLYSSYPVFELLAKSGLSSLVGDLILELASAYTKTSTLEIMKRLGQIIDPNTTKGSAVLKVPNYIFKAVKSNNYSYIDLINFMNIYEQTGISAENFDKFICSPIFIMLRLNGCLDAYVSLLKYGYSITKLNSYIEKQIKNSSNTHYRNLLSIIIRLIYDYNNNCDLLFMENHELYPQNIKQAHDEVMVLKREVDSKKQDEDIAEISKRFCPNGVFYTTRKDPLLQEYQITVPASTKDFIEEGINQSNCVGGYISRVINKNCVVFFIRRKDSPNDSFITAECDTKGQLTQIFFANNRPVDNESYRMFAREFCTSIKPKL